MVAPSRSIPFALPIVEGDALRAMTTHLLALPGDGVAVVWIDATDTTAIVAPVAHLGTGRLVAA